MTRDRISHLLLFAAALFLLGFSHLALAAGQHGGGSFHGGGGGFHGGGGAFHGGGGFRGGGGSTYRGAWGGGYRGGFGGYRGGWGGYRGGYGWRGYGGWGWGYPGWGWGLGIGFAPYWGWGYGYPYAYGYPPYYPYDSYDRYESYEDSNDEPDAPQEHRYARPPERRGPAREEQYPITGPGSGAGSTARKSNYVTPVAEGGQSVGYEERSSSARPAVQNVIRALQCMPPDARHREIASGRYRGLSQEEWKLVRTTAKISPEGD